MDPLDPPGAPLPPPSPYRPEARPPDAYRVDSALPPKPRPVWAMRADRAEFVQWAFYAGLASGVLILLCAFSVALLMTIMMALGGPAFGWPWVTDADGDAGFAVPFLFAMWGLFTGGAVLLGALRLKERPDATAVPGIVILAGGLLSFLAFGGFLVGGLLAIVAGVLAIAGARSVLAMRGPRLGRDERPPTLP